MRLSLQIRTIAACALVFGALLASSGSHAQDEAVSECEGVPYTEGYLVAASGINNCKIFREIERATKRFFNAQCRLLEARSRAGDPRSYAVVNQLVVLAQLELAEASNSFFAVSEQIDTSIALVAGEQSEGANQILTIYGYRAPQFYWETFMILGDVTAKAASQLSDLKFGERGDQSYAIDSMYSLSGAFMRPGGVYQAVAELLRQGVV